MQPFGHNTPTLQTEMTDRQRRDSLGRTVLETVAQQNFGVKKLFARIREGYTTLY